MSSEQKTRYTSLADLAHHISDELGLPRTDVQEAIARHRDLFGRYEDIDDATYETIQRAVWADLLPGAEWPWGAQ